MPQPHLQFEGISKRFPGVQALQDVSFGAEAGSVHALMGENGAGKSTLLKLLAGVYQPDGGAVVLAGEASRFTSTSDAIEAGIAVIYQELHLVPELSVAENLYLGHMPHRGGWLRRRQLLEQARNLLETLGEPVDPRTPLGRLPIGQRQMVEIAKALSRDAKVIAFDEPTSSLSAREADRLFEVICRLRDQGKVVLYVSHRMDEIFGVCDAATVLRDGRHVETFATLKDVDRGLLVHRMVGRSIQDTFQYRPRPHGDVVLRVEGVRGRGLSAPVSFSLRCGEILGIFGLVGAGRTELLRLIYGAERPAAGHIDVAGRSLRRLSPTRAINHGVVLSPEDRKKEGIIPTASVMENLNLSARRHFSRLRFVIDERRERANAEAYVQKLAIRTPSLHQAIRHLSGGNQQKVILARWLSENAVKVILLDEPTRGIDVGAKGEIYSIIYRLAEQGIGVVMVSSELPEVLGISDRVLVMSQGQVTGALHRDDATQERVLQLALPAAPSREALEALT